MLKSTYKPSANSLQTLPQGWTEHKAPTGHTYYYNAETKESTYKRPVAPPTPLESYHQSQAVPQVNLSDPNVANAFMAQYAPPAPSTNQRGGHGGGGDGRPRPQPRDRPKSKVAIPGCDPWVLVYTKYGRRFAYNPEKKTSYWRIPEKLKAGILELDQARIREKAAGGKDRSEEGANKGGDAAANGAEPATTHDYDSSEYEEVEVEVTDSEAESEKDGENEEAGNRRKRQRTEEHTETEAGPVEFTEADMAAQLAAMGAEYGLDEYQGDEDGADADPGDSGLPLSADDARLLFHDLLDDMGVNPYSTWDVVLEQKADIVDDPRYTVLSSGKARRAAFETWSRERIATIRAQRAREEADVDARDPRPAYLCLLHERATPKLFWTEFRRKYRTEPAMRDRALADRDRERLYREHIKRLALPAATAKADLKSLLVSVPRTRLNRATDLGKLPLEVRADVRYITLDAKTRDELVAAYVQDLDPPEIGEVAPEKDEEAAKKTREDRARRERELAVAEAKREEQRRTHMSKARLQEEEREIERALHVGKKGLQGQLGTGGGKGDDGERQGDADMET